MISHRSGRGAKGNFQVDTGRLQSYLYGFFETYSLKYRGEPVIPRYGFSAGKKKVYFSVGAGNSTFPLGITAPTGHVVSRS